MIAAVLQTLGDQRPAGAPPNPAVRYSSVLVTPRFRTSRHVVFLVRREGCAQCDLVVKASRIPHDGSFLAREAANLRAVQAARKGGFSSIPRLLAFQQFSDTAYLAETALPGRPMSPAFVRRQPDFCIRSASHWLAELHRATAAPVQQTTWWRRLVEQPFAQFQNLFPPTSDEHKLLCGTRQLLGSLHSAPVPQVFAHGDFSAPNILVDPQGGIGVLDWELAEPGGVPLTDLFFFLAFVAFARARARRVAQYLAAFREAFWDPRAWARPYIRRQVAELGLPPSVVRPLFVLCWSSYATRLAARLQAETTPHTQDHEETVAWLRASRFLALWRHSVQHADSLRLID